MATNNDETIDCGRRPRVVRDRNIKTRLGDFAFENSYPTADAATRLRDALLFRRVFLLVPAQGFVAKWIQSFREFPPTQNPASFSLEQVMEKLSAGAEKNHSRRSVTS